MKNWEKNNLKDDNKYYIFEQQIVYIEHVETLYYW